MVTPTSGDLSERASFDAFFNCYLREVDEGRWYSRQEWQCRSDGHCRSGAHWRSEGHWVVELQLTKQSVRLAVGIVYHSRAGRHRCDHMSVNFGTGWTSADRFWVLLLLCRELRPTSELDGSNETARQRETEFLARLTQSHQLMRLYVEKRRCDMAFSGDDFIHSEQSLLFGHWLHPTPKSRQGAADWQQESYAPELKAQFPLHYFAVREEHLDQDSDCSQSASTIVAALLCRMGHSGIVRTAREKGEWLLPAHPLQAQWLLAQPHVQRALSDDGLRYLGALGDAFAPTSSVRTVYRRDCDWMLKFSVPLKITNSVRVNQPHELRAGVLMSSVCRKLSLERRFPSLLLVPDPAYLNVRFAGVARSGFEVVLRHNPFQSDSCKGVHSIASLVQEPLPHRPSRLKALIDGLVLMEGRSALQISRDWFMRYLKMCIEPILRLYDEFGIALEAHQQNMLLNVSCGYPTRAYFRDNQGYYLSRTHEQRLLLVEPRLAECSDLFYDDAIIQARFSYYLVSNQLFSVIWRLGCDGLLHEEEALCLVAQRLFVLRRQFNGPAAALVTSLLEASTLSYKANLLTRLFDVDELTTALEQAVYTQVDNPIVRSLQAQIAREGTYAVA